MVDFSIFIDTLGATVGLIDMLALYVDIFNNIRHIDYCGDSSVEHPCLPKCLPGAKQVKNEHLNNERNSMINKVKKAIGIEPTFEAWEAKPALFYGIPDGEAVTLIKTQVAISSAPSICWASWNRPRSTLP